MNFYVITLGEYLPSVAAAWVYETRLPSPVAGLQHPNTDA